MIYIESNSGAVKRQGRYWKRKHQNQPNIKFQIFFNCLNINFVRSDTFATEFDLEAEEYVPLPKGDVHKRKEVKFSIYIQIFKDQ